MRNYCKILVSYVSRCINKGVAHTKSQLPRQMKFTFDKDGFHTSGYLDKDPKINLYRDHRRTPLGPVLYIVTTLQMYLLDKLQAKVEDFDSFLLKNRWRHCK
jgi:hypothetical protein